jgi:hypothetical protein
LHFFLEETETRTDLRLTTLTLEPSSENESKTMRKILLSMTLAGLCVQQAAAQQITHPTSGPPAARHIGDGVRSIGDTGRSAADTHSSAPVESRSKTLAKPISMANAIDSRILAPTLSCNTSCKPTRGWFTAETLLWFSDNINSPALVTSADQGVLPVAGNAGVTTEVGGEDGINMGLLPGYRLSAGRYFGDCDQYGIGGRVYGIYTKDEGFQGASNGSTSLGVPFFNMNLAPPDNDAFLVSHTTGGLTSDTGLVSTGAVAAGAELDMVGADSSLYVLLGKSQDHRVDMLAGYTFNRLKSKAGVETESTNWFTGDGIPNGTVFETSDLFATNNVFHGAHLGVLSTVSHERVNFSTMARVSFGNMRQTSDVSGSTVTSFGGVSDTDVGGIFAQQSNIGTQQRDRFAFIPEMALKLGYAPRENVELTVGYTFMYWSSVAMAGDQMDPSIDLTQVGGAMGTRPESRFDDGGFWMQGVDLGVNWLF